MVSASLEKNSFDPCDSCERSTKRTWLCVQCCAVTLCDKCWTKQIAHKPGKIDDDGIPHERTEKHIVDYLKPILEPPNDRQELNRMHEDDESTHWFGVDIDPAQKQEPSPILLFSTIKGMRT